MEDRFIVSAIICNGDRVLLGKKAKGRPPYPDVWHLPGGGTKNKNLSDELVKNQDYDNSYFQLELKREIKEETGLEIKNIHCICPQFRLAPREAETKNKDNREMHYIFLEYLCEYVNGKPKAAGDLIKVQWFSKNKLDKISLTPPSQEMYHELGWIK